MLLLGLLLTVAAMPVSSKNKGTLSIQKGADSSGDEITHSELEEKLADLLANVEGVGQVKVILMTGGEKNLYSQESEQITGVLIAAEGADDPVTVQNIQQAVMALFQVDAHKIRIMKMK